MRHSTIHRLSDQRLATSGDEFFIGYAPPMPPRLAGLSPGS